VKIIDVAEFYADKGGGVKTYINKKLEAGKKNGHDIIIVAPGPEDRVEERNGGKIIWVRGPALFLDPRYYVLYREKAVHEILSGEMPDVVEGSSPWTGGWFTARWKGDAVRTFIFHQDPVAVYPETFLDRIIGPASVNRLFFWYWAYLRKLSRKFDATIVSGKWLADKLADFNIKRPIPVPFGIDREQFSPEKKNPEIRNDLLRKCGVSEKGKLLVTISRYHPEKRLGMLLRAFGYLSKNHDDLGYVIFGDGPLHSLIKNRAKKIPRLYLAGYVDDRDYISSMLASADVMVHGSTAETYGLVIAEAICSGLPVVVPDRGGAFDLAGEVYSEVYQTGNHRACAGAVEKTLAKDRDLTAKAALERAVRGIGTMDDHFRLLFSTYEKLVEEKMSREQ